MKTNLACTQPKLDNMRGVDDLRCVKHPDSYAFMTRFHEPQEDGSSISVGVDLRVAHIEGNVCFTMRRVAEMVHGLGQFYRRNVFDARSRAGLDRSAHRRIGVIPPKVAGLIVDYMGALHEGDDQLKMAEISIFAGPLQVFNSRDSLKCLRKRRGLGSS